MDRDCGIYSPFQCHTQLYNGSVSNTKLFSNRFLKFHFKWIDK